MLTVVTDDNAHADMSVGLDEIVREGARRMLAVALEAEVAGYIEALAGELDEEGRRLVVRNGHSEPRTIITAAGGIEIEAPRVDDRRVDPETGQRCRFRSALVPPWCRKSPKVTEVLPLMYLHGMSSGDFAPALEEFFGSAAGLSPSVITRLTKSWQAEQRAFAERRLDDRDYVYTWADGIHFNVRLEEARLCALVIVGVRADGTKELVAITDGHRESTDSWADLLRTSSVEACGRRWWPWATAPSGSGPRCARCGPRPPRLGAGSTRWRTASTPCPRPCSRRRSGCWRRSATPRTGSTPSRPSTPSPASSR
jgi:transposase-like protein